MVGSVPGSERDLVELLILACGPITYSLIASILGFRVQGITPTTACNWGYTETVRVEEKWFRGSAEGRALGPIPLGLVRV